MKMSSTSSEDTNNAREESDLSLAFREVAINAASSTNPRCSTMQRQRPQRQQIEAIIEEPEIPEPRVTRSRSVRRAENLDRIDDEEAAPPRHRPVQNAEDLDRIEVAPLSPSAAQEEDLDVFEIVPAAPSTSRRPRKQAAPLARYIQLQREMNRLQRTSQFMIPRLSFGRVVRELLMTYTTNGADFRITMGALEALQGASEMYLTQRFSDCNLIVLNRKQVTLQVRDMKLMSLICQLHGQL